MSVQSKDLWSLVLHQQYVDPEELAEAIESQTASGDLDFRTRLLIRDGCNALQNHWGSERWRSWLAACPVGRQIETIIAEDLGKPGFPFLARQVVEPTRPDTVRQMLRELGQHVHQRARMCVGGSVALILPGYLSRQTQDLDVVDEVPAELRSQHQFLHQLEERYRLQLAHFQSHYLPSGWEQRLHFLDAFGTLQVYLVDVYDIFLSKLFSIRTKDLDDLRALAPQLDKEVLIDRLRRTTGSMLVAESLRERAQNNWYILYGETLPA